MSMPLEILIYTASLLIGLLIGWLNWGVYKSKYNQLYTEASKDKHSLNKLIKDFKSFKKESESEIDQAHREKRKWKKLSETLSMTKDDNSSNEDIDEWKRKCEQLEKLLKKKNSSKHTSANKAQLILLEEQLHEAEHKIKKQDLLLLKAKKEAFPTEQEPDTKGLKKQVKKLKAELEDKNTQIEGLPVLEKRNAKLRKKLIKLKKEASKRKQKETIQITESIDMKKLMHLLQEGTLTVSKRKVIKNK